MADIHYLVGSADDGDGVEHIHAESQEAAVDKFINGGNGYGYDAEHYDGDEIMVVPLSKVDSWNIEVVPPTKVEVKLTKAKTPATTPVSGQPRQTD
jgi:hypothetical protein